MTGEELEPLTRAKELAARLNDVLRHLPGYRVVSYGTRISVESGDATFYDAGLDYVAQFAKVFGASTSKEPKLPEISLYAASIIAGYHAQVARLAEELKLWAQTAAEQGDEGGSLMLIRLQLNQEELAELAEAIIDRDIVGCLDALTDMTYVTDGAYLSLGLGHYKLAALAEVHRSNMSKLGPDGVPILSSAGRVVKGPDYSPPDLKAVLGITENVREDGEFGDGVTVVHGGSGRRDEPGSW